MEVAVCDAADGRLIPGLEVEATLTGPDGEDLGTHPLPLLWHPYLCHYGRNWKVPGEGAYTLGVRFPAPAFARHDEKNGRRSAEGAVHVFENVSIKDGQD